MNIRNYKVQSPENVFHGTWTKRVLCPNVMISYVIGIMEFKPMTGLAPVFHIA